VDCPGNKWSLGGWLWLPDGDLAPGLFPTFVLYG